MYINAGSRKNILLLHTHNDDGELLNFQIEKHFSKAVNVLLVTSSREALKKVKLQKFDFIISEQSLIEEGVMPFLHNIMQTDMNKETPLAVIEDGTQDENKSLKGKINYLPRPIDYSKLMQLLADHLGLSESEQYKSATIYTEIIGTINLICNQAFEYTVSTGEPQLKKFDKNIIGETVILFELEYNGFRSNYIIGIDDACLDALSNELSDTVNVSSSATAKALVNVSINQLNNLNSSNDIELHSKEVLDEDNELRMKLNMQPGVFIPLSTGHGTIRVYSF